MLTFQIDGTKNYSCNDGHTTHYAGEIRMMIIDNTTQVEEVFSNDSHSSDRGQHAGQEFVGCMAKYVTRIFFEDDDISYDSAFDEVHDAIMNTDIYHAIVNNRQRLIVRFDESKMESAEDFEKAIQIVNISPAFELKYMIEKHMPDDVAARAIELLREMADCCDLGLVGKEKIWQI